MIIAKRLKGKAIAAWLGQPGDAVRNAVRRFTAPGKRLDFYYDLADPWSYLTAQAVERLLKVYPVELGFHAITPPAADVDGPPGLRAKHAVRDAHQLADFYDLEFTGKREADSGMLRDVQSAMIKERPATEQLTAVLELAKAMWAGDKKQLTALLGKWGAQSTGQIAPILNTNYNQMRKAGHYQGAMLAYGGEWYWGIDRLPFLEEALARDTNTPLQHVVTERTDRPAQKLSDKPLACELWYSFRSPYSYLALERISDTIGDLPLTLRPVLPMVQRGIGAPRVKTMYIAHDAKREADKLGIPFGELCDPLGKGVENCIALAKFAEKRGKQLAFARSAMRGIWSEARDVTAYVDLRYVVERAELPWEEAKEALTDPEAQKWAQANATDLLVYGLWGMPSMRCGDFVAWGQDRLPMLADRLRRHAQTSP